MGLGPPTCYVSLSRLWVQGVFEVALLSLRHLPPFSHTCLFPSFLPSSERKHTLIHKHTKKHTHMLTFPKRLLSFLPPLQIVDRNFSQVPQWIFLETLWVAMCFLSSGPWLPRSLLDLGGGQSIYFVSPLLSSIYQRWRVLWGCFFL